MQLRCSVLLGGVDGVSGVSECVPACVCVSTMDSSDSNDDINRNSNTSNTQQPSEAFQLPLNLPSALQPGAQALKCSVKGA